MSPMVIDVLIKFQKLGKISQDLAENWRFPTNVYVHPVGNDC